MNKNYVVWLQSDKKSDNTIKNYVKYINAFLNYVNKDEKDVTVEDLLDYRGTISNLSSASISLQINSIKSYFRFLEEMGIVEKNIFEKVKAPKVNNKVKPYITKEDISNLIKNADSIRDMAIIATTASTGLRMAELCSITNKQWEDMKKYGTRIITIVGKGNKERTVFINDMVMNYVEKYLPTKKNTSGFVFESHEGNALDESNFCKTLKATAKRANLPYCDDISMHWLRTAFATIANANGVDIATISSALGHSSIAITSRYIKTNQSNINEAMNMMQF